MKSFRLLYFLMLSPLVNSCAKLNSEYGYSKIQLLSFSSKQQLLSFSSSRPYNKNNWYYCGTDQYYHHFLTRIGGETKVFLVPKEEIKLSKIVKLPDSGLILLYKIYPDKNFSFGKETIDWYYSH